MDYYYYWSCDFGDGLLWLLERLYSDFFPWRMTESVGLLGTFVLLASKSSKGNRRNLRFIEIWLTFSGVVILFEDLS